MIKKLIPLLAVLLSLGLSTVAHATLMSRLGGDAYYDTATNLTWLADANKAGTTMQWSDANAWADNLNIDGVTGWRLPTTTQPDSTCDQHNGSTSYGYNCTGSEMGNLFYNVLGGTEGSSLTSTTPFTHVQSSHYWSATEYAPYTGYAWGFDFYNGFQGNVGETGSLYAWAVRSGDVGAATAVPEPGTLGLMVAGLVGLLLVVGRRRLALR